MKILSLILIVGVGIYLFNQAGPWSKEKKNYEIAAAIKGVGAEVIRDLKSDEYIADANIKHDKKKCGIIYYIKMVELPRKLTNREISQIRTEMKIEISQLIRQKNDPDIEEVRRIIKKGIYVMFRYYLNNGKVFATMKLTKDNI